MPIPVAVATGETRNQGHTVSLFVQATGYARSLHNSPNHTHERTDGQFHEAQPHFGFAANHALEVLANILNVNSGFGDLLSIIFALPCCFRDHFVNRYI